MSLNDQVIGCVHTYFFSSPSLSVKISGHEAQEEELISCPQFWTSESSTLAVVAGPTTGPVWPVALKLVTATVSEHLNSLTAHLIV